MAVPARMIRPEEEPLAGLALAGIPAGVMVLDSRGLVLFASAVAVNLLGCLLFGIVWSSLEERWPASGERRGQLVRVRVEASDGQECFGISARAFASRLSP